jgi:ABC-type transport system involved in cytochrome c biogenesis permease subunit
MLASWVYLVGGVVPAVAKGAFDGNNVGMPMSAGGSMMVVFTGPPKCSGSAAPALALVDPSTAVHVAMAMSALAPTAAHINLNLLNLTIDHSQIDLVGRSRPGTDVLSKPRRSGEALVCVA